MKKFIMDNWRRIIFCFAGFAILINLIMVTFTPKTVVDDYAKYGPDYSSDLISNAQDINIEDGESEFSERMAQDTGLSPNVVTGIIIFAIVCCVILALQNIIDSKSAAPAKKK